MLQETSTHGDITHQPLMCIMKDIIHDHKILMMAHNQIMTGMKSGFMLDLSGDYNGLL